MRQTKQSRSIAAKKGWQKRHLRTPKVIEQDFQSWKKQHEKKKLDRERAEKAYWKGAANGISPDEKHRFKVAGATVVTAGSAKGVAAHRNFTKYQHRWLRPNGDEVELRGFRGKRLKHMQTAADAVDQQVASKVHLENVRIKSSQNPLFKLLQMAGATAPGYEDKVEFMKDMIEGQPPENRIALRKQIKTIEEWNEKGGVGRKLMEVLHRATGGAMGHKVQVSIPDSIAKGDNAPGILVHEIGHAIDHPAHQTITKSPAFRRSFKWASDAPMATGVGAMKKSLDMDPGNDLIHLPGYTARRGAYQAVSPAEDFAESFRTRLGLRLKPSKHAISPDVYNATLGKERNLFLDKHIMKDVPTQEAAKIVKKEGIHQHYDKFLIGGVVAAAAGYGYYKHRQFAKQRELEAAKRRRAVIQSSGRPR